MTRFLPSLNQEHTGQPSKKNWVWLLVVLGALIFIVSVALFFGSRSEKELESLQAQIEGKILDLRAPMSGLVQSVNVREGQKIARGQVILVYDDSRLRLDYLEALAGYQAAIQGFDPGLPDAIQLNQTLDEIRLEIQRLRQIEQTAQQDIEHWTIVQARALLALRTPGASAPAQDQAVLDETEAGNHLDQARQQHENAVNNRQQAENRLQSLQQMSGNVSGQELVELWLARCRQAEQSLTAASLLAPEAGRITLINIQPENQTIHGDVVLSYIPDGFVQENYWVTAVFATENLADLKPGLPCRVETDTVKCRGQISGISIEQDHVLVKIQLDQSTNPDKLYIGQLARVFAALP